jgi:hypothetical protein
VNRRVALKVLLACLISSLAPVGLSVWLFAAHGQSLSGWPLALSLLLSLAVALVIGVLAAAWATGGRNPLGAVQSPTDNTRLPLTAQQPAERQANLYHASQAISNTLDLEDICKLIVEVHGGQIGMASQVGAGTSFYFTLPLADGA